MEQVETVEALHQIGQLGPLKEKVAQKEATKLDHSELEKLRLLLLEEDEENINLRARVSSLRGRDRDLQAEKGKIRQLEDALGKPGVAGGDQKEDGGT
ncbi:hypothetical protein llap_8488 [Limosa lapponica baueri]|uniref:Uncharacterized protein n=1 Tax=Limosa lapponica baueri TaxID=1758121 RepID=A0A2I0U5E6_LIMLA|nr:hypothetical protein llap_8488 [Limosa lapponica baueri]